MLNVRVITHWQQNLPEALESLTPLHCETLIYVMGLPGKREPAYSHAKQPWSLNREQFDRERKSCVRRHQLKRYAFFRSTDLEFV